MGEEKRFAVVPVELRFFCDCGGEMIATGMGKTMLDTQWLHKCKLCYEEKWLAKNYPVIIHEVTGTLSDPLTHWTPDHTVNIAACGKVVGLEGSRYHINNPDPDGPVDVTCTVCETAQEKAWTEE